MSSFLRLALVLAGLSLIPSLAIAGGKEKSAREAERCQERMAHMGDLLAGVSVEQEEAAELIIHTMKENGVLPTVLAHTLENFGITPQKPGAWRFFSEDLQLLPDKADILATTAARLTYEVFGVPELSTTTSVEEAKRFRIEPADYMEMREKFPKLPWTKVLEYALLTDPGLVKETQKRMSGFFPTRRVALRPGFPAQLKDLRDSYSSLPDELVTLDLELRLASAGLAEMNEIISDINSRGWASSDIARRAREREGAFSEAIRAQNTERYLLAAAREKQDKIDAILEIERGRDSQKWQKLEADFRKLEHTRIELSQRKENLKSLLEKQQKGLKAPISAIPTARDEAVKAWLNAFSAKARFIKARKEWRRTRLVPSSPKSDLRRILLTEEIEDALRHDEIDHDAIREALEGSACEKDEDFVAIALSVMHFILNDQDISFYDRDLVTLVANIEEAAESRPGGLSEKDVLDLRAKMTELEQSLEDPESLRDKEAIEFRAVILSNAWMTILRRHSGKKSGPLTELEMQIYSEMLSWEARVTREGYQEFDLTISWKDLTETGQPSQEQFLSIVDSTLDEYLEDNDYDDGDLIAAICEGAFHLPHGLPTSGILALRNKINGFVIEMSDDDEKDKARKVLFQKESQSKWQDLEARHARPAGAAAEVTTQATPASEPTEAATVVIDAPKPAEVLPPEIQELKEKAQRLFRTAREYGERGIDVRAEVRKERELRRDIRKMLRGAALGFGDAAEMVVDFLRKGHQTLSQDRFAAVFSETAVLHGLGNHFTKIYSQLRYARELLEFAKSLDLNNLQVTKIAASFFTAMTLRNNEGRRALFEHYSVIFSAVLDWALEIPLGLTEINVARIQTAIRRLIEDVEVGTQNPIPSLSTLLRQALADTRWHEATTRSLRATESALELVNQELAEIEQKQKEARESLSGP